MDWLMGLQNLVNGAQTDPAAFAMKATAAGVDPGQIELLLQQQLGLPIAQTPGQTTGAVPRTFDNMLYGGQDQQMLGLSASPIAGNSLPPMAATTLPQVGPTAERLPQAGSSPLLKGMTPGWETMDPTKVDPKAFETANPGLTPEQLAKLASLIPKATVPPMVGSGGGGHAAHTVQTTGLSVPQRQRTTLAQILGR